LWRLAALSVALAAVVWYRWGPAEPAPAASNLPAAAPGVVPALRLPERLQLAMLDAVPAETEVGRNPFGFGARPAPPSPAVAYTPPPVTLPTGPPVPQGPPPIMLRLVGLMIAPGSTRPMVTLKDPGTGALFHAFEGDVVDGRYRVVKVGMQSAVLSYVDGSGQRTLAMGN
jgi:hypothetical protein